MKIDLGEVERLPEAVTDTVAETVSADSIHGSTMFDMDEAILVNVKTRDFLFGPNFSTIVGVVGDHNSSIVTFSLPRYIDGHDISACAEHRVLWRSVTVGDDEEKIVTASGYFDAKNIKTSEDEDNNEIVLIEWLISSDVTAYESRLEFALSISDYDSEGQVVYRWRTRMGAGLLIVTGPEEGAPTVPGGGSFPDAPETSFTLIDADTGDKYMLYVSGGKLKMDLVV